MTQTQVRIARCPHCGANTRLDTGNPWRPFCSERCKLIDLGDWLGERYGIPAQDADGNADAADTADAPPRRQ